LSPVADFLAPHRHERDDLLQRIIALLQVDDRIAAAWLHGSIGRATHDDWSDIDLWIVVADDHMEAIRAERSAFVHQLGELLFTVEAPQNAPPDGTYLLALYPGTQGPNILDCSWQPQSKAQRPLDTQLLFDKANISTFSPPTPTPVDNPLELAAHQTAFFWMMVTIIAKYIARRQSWQVINLLSFLWSVTAQISWLAGERTTPTTYADTPPFPVSTTPHEQLTILRDLTTAVEGLMARNPALREAVSYESIGQVKLYLDTVESSISVT
jgi:hypothetical protein